MRELDCVLGQRLVHEGVVDFSIDDDGAHGYGTVSHLLGDVHHVGRDAEEISASVGAHAPEGRNDFVKDEQDVVLVADLAKTLQITLGRDKHPGRPGHGFYDHCCNVGGVVQFDELEQLVREFHAACFGLTASEGEIGLQGMRQMVDIHHGAKQLAVATYAAHAGATDVHPVVAAGSANEF